MKQIKRFIAGAVCPSCKAMDTIRTYKDEEKTYRECVNCGFHDELRIQSQIKELTTRVNISESQKEEDTQTVRILPFKEISSDK